MPVELRSEILRTVTELQPVAAGQAVLARGDRGEGVRAFQRGLIALGYALGGGADGIFGPSSEKGLTDFRTLHDLLGAAVLDEPALAALDGALVRLQAVASYSLAHARFAGDAVLAQVMAGATPLPAEGEAVAKVQQALVDLLFPLPRFGVDGELGGETRAAMSRFQRWQRIRPGGELTPLSLMALDQVAPPPGAVAERHPEYATMIRDGLLTVTLAIGYDEGDNDLSERQQIEAGLAAEGFVRQRSAAGDGATTYTRALEIPGATGTLRLRVVTRATQQPERHFVEGLVHDAVTIYSGHARYGTGPDFDPKESTAENFVIGIGAPQHAAGTLRRGYDEHMNQILAGVPNDLVATRFDPKLDQLWAFLGCTTTNYLDELRVLVDGKDTTNLDLVVSTRPIYWRDGAFFSLEILRGLVRGVSINAMVKALCDRAVATEQSLGESQEGDAFITDGFGDNPVA